MPISGEYLERCAEETGYPAASLERVTRLGEIASAIGRSSFLAERLSLKGGTALNLCTGGAPTRLSVDLDYNYTGHVDRIEMQAERPVVEARLREIVAGLGYRVQASAEAFAGRKFLASYRSAFGPEDRVELDVNYIWRVPLDGVRRTAMWQPGDLDRPEITVVSKRELAVGKLLALIDRAAPRDAWDTSRLPMIAGDELSSAEFRRAFVALSAVLIHPLATYDRHRMATKLSARSIDEHLRPMLIADATVDPWSLVEEAWRVVEPLLRLTADERTYTEEIAAGRVRTELLFPDEPERSALFARHPAIQWKVMNVRAHRRAPDVDGSMST